MHRTNNFDSLRLIFALTVVLVHASELSQSPSLSWIPKVLDSQVAVEGFFAMSGFLIVGSYERSHSLRGYLDKRARRILPAYWASLIFALVLGAAVTTLPWRIFLGSRDTWRFVGTNLILMNFLHPSLPGVFTHNPAMNAVNGALWTIKLEVLFYLVVPVLVWVCRRGGQWQMLVSLSVLSLAYRLECLRFHHETLSKQLPGQLCFFAGGILIYYYLPYFTRRRSLTWLLVSFLVLVNFVIGGVVLEALVVPISTMAVAFLLPHLLGPTKYGDFSYGIYVFHFPIIQALVAAGAFVLHPYFALAEALIIVSVVAVLSWRFIEAPALKVRPSKKPDRSEIAKPEGERRPKSEDVPQIAS